MPRSAAYHEIPRYSTSVEYDERARMEMQKVTRKPLRRRPGRPAKGQKDQPQGNLALLRAAQSSFARYGFEGVSLRGIAAAAGVDPGLATHYFGTKQAMWEAVIERLAERCSQLVSELQDLVTGMDNPIEIRLETAFRQLINICCEEPDFGMFVARIGSERGEKLEFLISKLLRPYHDPFQSLLKQAMKAKVIRKQPVEVLYFMILHAVAMTVSYRHLLEHFEERPGDMDQLKADMTRCILATFLNKEDRGPIGKARSVKSPARRQV